MTHTVSVYWNGILLGTGVNTANSATTGTYDGTAPVNGRNVQVAITSGTQAGAVYRARLLSGSGTTSLVFNHVDSYPD